MDENFIVDFGEVTRVITDDFNKLNNRPSYAGELMTGDTNIPQVPSSVSELNNDSNYQTGTQVSEAIGTETEAREAADTALDGRLTTVEGIAATALQPSSIDKVVMTDINVGANTSTTTFNLDASKQNLLTGATSSKQVSMPVASSTEAGIMNSSTFDAVVNNTANINALANGAVAITGLPSSPTQAQLTTAWENATGETSLMNRAGIYDVTNGKVWTYYTNDTTWHSTTNTTQVTINTFTNSSEGTIKGSTNVGQVFAEADGTGSVNGWDALNDAVGNNSSAISGLQTAVNGKQDKLIAGTNINIAADGKTISATDTTYTAGNAIDITNGEISADIYPADFFTASGSISDCGSNLSLDNTIASTLKSVEVKGDTYQQTAPSPDYPQPVNVVTSEQTIYVRGKNMFNVNKPLENKYLDNSGGWATSTYSYVNQEYIVTGSSELSFSFAKRNGSPTIRVGEFKTDGTFIKRTLVSTALTLTLDALTNKIIFSVDNLSPNYFDELQIELGSSPTSYQPYTSQSYTVDLDAIELCKIGDYQDYIYKSGDDWYVHKETNAKSIDGTEAGWGKSGVTENNAYYLSTDIFNDMSRDGIGVGQFDTHITPTFSRYFVATSSNDIFTTNIAGLGFNAQPSPSVSLDLRIGTGLSSPLDTVQLFKDWLGVNKPTIYYVLATPTDTKITDATLVTQLNAVAGAKSYNGQTNVVVTATGENLPAALCVEVYRKSLNGLLGVIERLGA